MRTIYLMNYRCSLVERVSYFVDLVDVRFGSVSSSLDESLPTPAFVKPVQVLHVTPGINLKEDQPVWVTS